MSNEIIYVDELYHHGILGQKWGKRQGPPYPLDPSDHSAAERKAGWRKSVSKEKENYKIAKQNFIKDKRNAEKTFTVTKKSALAKVEAQDRLASDAYKLAKAESEYKATKIKNEKKASKAEIAAFEKRARLLNDSDQGKYYAEMKRKKGKDFVNKVKVKSVQDAAIKDAVAIGIGIAEVIADLSLEKD